MTFYNEDQVLAQQYRAQQELQALLRRLVPGETKVRIPDYARKQRPHIGIYQGYHPEKQFPFEISIQGRLDFFALGQFGLVEESEGRS